MDLINALIIYFAFGVPFGVLAVFLRSERLLPGDFVRVTYHLTFWPVILIVRGLISFRTSVTGHLERSERTVSIQRGNLHERDVRSRQAIFEGLRDAHRISETAVELRLPFEDCIVHPYPQLAAKCFQRRNLWRLERHIAEARNDLVAGLDGNTPGRSTDRNAGTEGLEQTVPDLC